MKHFKEWWDNLEPWEPWVYALVIITLCVGSFTCFSKWNKNQIKTVQTEYTIESKQVKEVIVNGAEVKKFCLGVRVNEKGGEILKTVVVSPTVYKKSEKGKPAPFQATFGKNGKIIDIKCLN